MALHPIQLHIARSDWVFLSALSSQMEDFGLLSFVNPGDFDLCPDLKMARLVPITLSSSSSSCIYSLKAAIKKIHLKN